MRALALAAVLSSLAAAGCAQEEDRQTFVVRFTLDAADGGQTLEATEYPHCSTAHLASDHVRVDDRIPAGSALVYIQPRFNGTGWASLGDGAMARGLDPEVRVPDGVRGTTTAVTVLRWEDGRLLIDGMARTLPFTGTARDPAGSWNGTFTVEEGPRGVRVDHSPGSCA